MKIKNILLTISFILIAGIFWIAVTLNGEFTTVISIPVEVYSQSKDFSLDSEVPNELIVKIKTSGWKILRTKLNKDKMLLIDLSKYQNNSVIQLNKLSPEQFDLLPDINILDVKPESFVISLRRTTKKTVVVAPRLNITFKENYAQVSKTKIQPNELEVYGSSNILEKLDTIFTKEIKLENLSEDVSVTTELQDTLTNSISYSKQPITVIFKVEQIADKDFKNVFVELINVPKGKNIVLIPEHIDIKLRGGIKILSNLDSNSLKPYIDYLSAEIDSNMYVIPTIETPEGTELVKITPEKLSLIIKN